MVEGPSKGMVVHTTSPGTRQECLLQIISEAHPLFLTSDWLRVDLLGSSLFARWTIFNTLNSSRDRQTSAGQSVHP